MLTSGLVAVAWFAALVLASLPSQAACRLLKSGTGLCRLTALLWCPAPLLGSLPCCVVLCDLPVTAVLAFSRCKAGTPVRKWCFVCLPKSVKPLAVAALLRLSSISTHRTSTHNSRWRFISLPEVVTGSRASTQNQ